MWIPSPLLGSRAECCMLIQNNCPKIDQIIATKERLIRYSILKLPPGGIVFIWYAAWYCVPLTFGAVLMPISWGLSLFSNNFCITTTPFQVKLDESFSVESLHMNMPYFPAEPWKRITFLFIGACPISVFVSDVGTPIILPFKLLFNCADILTY